MRRSALIVIVTAVMIAGGPLGVGITGAQNTAPDAALDCEYPLTVEDATGEEITIEEPPERVVTTGPSAAQTLWEIGAAGQVVGLTDHAMYLEGAEERAVVSDEEGFIDVEKVIDAEPDLVLAPNATGAETVGQLREAGLTVYLFTLPTSLEDVMAHTGQSGELVGECDGAVSTIDWMADEIATIEAAVDGADRPTVLYTFYGFTAGSGTHIDDIIRTAGGDNVAADAGIEGYDQINDEIVVDADPDWIVVNSEDPALPDSAAFNETTAVREDRVVTVQIEHINQPAPWNVHALVTLVEQFHPEAYAAATDATTDAGSTDDASGDGTSADESEPLPGFGAAVALIAMIGAVIGIGRRR